MQRKVLGADTRGHHAPLERVTIRDFVSSNDKLLAVLGVFLGAAAFSTSSPVKPVGQIVVFCLLGAGWFLWFELFAIYRNECYPPSGQLQIFIVFLFVAFVAAIFYWLLEFSYIRQLVLSAILFQIVTNFTDRVNRIQSRVLHAVALISIWAVCFLISMPINLLFDGINHYLTALQEAEQGRPVTLPVELK